MTTTAEPTLASDELRIVATWLSRATDLELETLLAATVAGDDFDTLECAYAFEAEGWAEVGVTRSTEAVCWMTSGAPTPTEVRQSHDAGIRTWWELRLATGRTRLG